jgi:hypothetical protein
MSTARDQSVSSAKPQRSSSAPPSSIPSLLPKPRVLKGSWSINESRLACRRKERQASIRSRDSAVSGAEVRDVAHQSRGNVPSAPSLAFHLNLDDPNFLQENAAQRKLLATPGSTESRERIAKRSAAYTWTVMRYVSV